jgi:hypothetical protein
MAFSSSRLFFCIIGCFLLSAAQLATGTNPEVQINGNYPDHGYSTSRTALDGTVYDGGAGFFTVPAFTVIYHDTTGDGNVFVKQQTTKVGGRFEDGGNAVSQINYGVRSDGYVRSVTFSNVLYRVCDVIWPMFADAKVSPGQQTQFSQTVTVRFELLDPGNIVVDSVDVTVNLEYDVNLSNGTVTGSWSEVPEINLYENGTLPPGGRPDIVTQAPTFNTNVDGTITNNSDTIQTLDLWANTGAGGAAELWGSVSVNPGETIPVSLGLNLDPGMAAYLAASGEVSGTGNNIISQGTTESVNLTFPPQTPQDVTLIFDNGDFLPQTVTVGSEEAPQQYLTVEPGVSQQNFEYSGNVGVQGGTVQHQTTDNQGNVYITVSVPETAQAATVTGSATVATSSGTTSVTTVQMPSGNTVTVGSGGGSGSPVPSPDQTSPPAITSSSSGSSLDEAARELQEIRAELAAVAAAVESAPGETVPADDASAASIENAQESLDTFLDGTGVRDGEFFFIDGELPAFDPGSVDSVTVPFMGQTHEIVFDSPYIPWFRGFILIAISVGWLLFLIRFCRV